MAGVQYSDNSIIYGVKKGIIHNNTISGTIQQITFDTYGIVLSSNNEIRGGRNRVINNTLTYLHGGLVVQGEKNSTFISNYFHGNSYGMVVQHVEDFLRDYGYHLPSEFNAFENNELYSCQVAGIKIHNSMNNTFRFNTIEDDWIGIEFGDAFWGTTDVSSADNEISYNDFLYNRHVGISFTNNSDNNLVGWNNFVNNPISAIDYYASNHFIYNYYSDHVSTDLDNDSISDVPHKIINLVDMETFDPYPVLLNNPCDLQFVPDPVIISPASGLNVDTLLLIKWSQDICYDRKECCFNVYYQKTSGNERILLTATELTFFEWDITVIPDGDYYIIIESLGAGNSLNSLSMVEITVDSSNLTDLFADFFSSPLFFFGSIVTSTILVAGVYSCIRIKKITPGEFFSKYVDKISRSPEKE